MGIHRISVAALNRIALEKAYRLRTRRRVEGFDRGPVAGDAGRVLKVTDDELALAEQAVAVAGSDRERTWALVAILGIDGRSDHDVLREQLQNRLHVGRPAEACASARDLQSGSSSVVCRDCVCATGRRC